MGACVDTKSNGANCGVCGNMCGVGMVCNNGACTNSCGPLKKCGSSCVDTSTNADHCGGCDMPCPDGASCAASACLCPMGTTVCGGACLDTTSDPTNCGGCGVTCTGGAACENGNCLCPGGGVSCDGACVDTQADPTNCGMCGVACAAGQACTNGACACPGGAVSFAADIQPIFTASCTGMGCHGGAMPAGGLKLSTGNAYAALVNVASSQCPDGRKRVAPSDVANSYLMDKILGVDLCFGTQMPKMGSLPAAQIDKISTWICNGAPNN